MASPDQQSSSGSLHQGWLLAGCGLGGALVHGAAAVGADGGGRQLIGASVALVSVAAGILLVGARVPKWVYGVALVAGVASAVAAPVVKLSTPGQLAAIALGGAGAVLAVRILLAGLRPVGVGTAVAGVAACIAVAVAAVAVPTDDASDTDHAELMTRIDETRCDRSVNLDAYWDEAKAVGVDVYEGGTMTDHDMEGGSSSTTAPKVFVDPAIQPLADETKRALVDEGAPVPLVEALAKVSDDEYREWRTWLRQSEVLEQGHMAARPKNGAFGHSGHVGPQPWTALTDSDDCEAVADELARVKAVAMKYPTAADAEAAGWESATPYVGAIGAHFIDYSSVDETIELEHPEMLIYDGNGDGAHIVGLSYYVISDGNVEPDAGFTGENDHGHRHHVGLCIGPKGALGNILTNEADCRALGGVKDDGSRGWMSHAWVVPGCESPWGVFSAANPVLDGALGRSSASDGGHCAGSSVRGRYGLGPAPGS